MSNSTAQQPEGLPQRPRWTQILLLYPFLLYGLLASGHAVAEWLGLFSLGVLLLFPGLRAGAVLPWMVLALIAGIAGYATYAGHRAWVNYLPQVMICLFLMLVFGRTLRSNRVPLITRIAAAMRKGGAPVPFRYTRGVTIMWVVMFGLLALEGVVLAAFAPDIPFGRVSAITYAIMGIMIVGEFAFHTWRYPNPAQRGFPNFVRQLVQIDYRRLLND